MGNDKILTDKELKSLVKEIADHLSGREHIDNPRGFGYVNLASYDYEEEGVTLILFADVCKYKDDNDGHLYYGVYSCAEVDGGDNIIEHNWDYTPDIRQASLCKVLKDLIKTWPKDALLAEFNKVAF